MDTSETYIKMCEKAIEIQELWVPVDRHLGDGDFYFVDDYRWFTQIIPWVMEQRGEKTHWLPRQDQLQEMLESSNAYSLACNFSSRVDHFNTSWSMEQLWLAFVMKEKFGKYWSGEEWIDEKI